jgi:hypothetical protein
MLQYTTKKQRFFTIHMLHSSLNNALVVGSGWGDHGPPSTSGRIHFAGSQTTGMSSRTGESCGGNF